MLLIVNIKVEWQATMYLIPWKPNSNSVFLYVCLFYLFCESTLNQKHKLIVNIILLIGKAARLRRVHTW